MEMKEMKDRLKTGCRKAWDYLSARFKKFTIMRWVGCVFSLLVAVLCIMYAIMFTIDRAKGLPFFTDREGNAMHTYEILVTIVFYLVGLFLLGTWVYETFIAPIKPKYSGPAKDIVGGRVIEIPRASTAEDQAATQEADKKDASDENKDETPKESEDKKSE